MCGICGIVTTPGRDVARDVLASMTATLAHRGPDGDGFFVNGHIGLGHRRLSIIDLEGGAQPLANEDGSVVVVFNGEIFNYRDLTAELEARGHTFRTQSDTETLVHLYEEYGMGMLSKLRGMFAFALVDRNADAVYLVRDRFGIKPLFFHERAGTLYFASEIKPIIDAGCSVVPNPAAIAQYLQTRFVHGDETMFAGVYRLNEGSYLEWRRGRASIRRYYPAPPQRAREVSDCDADAIFESSFGDAVRAWMIADVPVGAYLSGGVDSSTIVSEMVRHTTHPIRTFCVEFDAGYSEAAAAAETAGLFGCEHETVVCGVNELLELPAVITSLEEPVGDPIVVAQYVLARATRRAGVKTVLLGDGADETLGGYQYLRAITQILTWSGRLPSGVLSRLGVSVAKLVPLAIVKALADVPLDLGSHLRDRLIEILKVADDPRRMYDLLLALYRADELDGVLTPEFAARAAASPAESFAGEPDGDEVMGKVLSMQYRKWLPAFNTKQDKLSMAHSIENRVPFLDHHFVEQMASMPGRLKIAGRENKVLLRRLARKRLPARASDAKKLPFHFPLQHYLHDARLWALVEDNTHEARVRRRGIVSPAYVQALKDQARRGDYLLSKKLMALVILEIWHRVFVDREVA